MLLDIILIIISGIFIFLYIKNKSLINILKRQLHEYENHRDNTHEEFSLGLTKLNSEFSDKILVDPLTGLPGRDAFNDRLTQALNQSQRFEKSFALMLLNIHEFHHINKSHSYEIGDKLIREVADRLKAVIRQIDTITRYAGNTFIILLPELSIPETAAYAAQRLIDNIVQPFEIDDKKICITASIGISIFPSDGNDTETLIKNADSALHQAKICGDGRYQFHHQDLHALGVREISLNKLISGPDLFQKLLIYYQPRINVITNQIVSIQAIPHIYLEDFGLVSFLEFSKIAENCGKIYEIGEWLVKNAVIQFQKWQREGLTAHTIAITVTLRQIEDPQFIYKVIQILKEHNVNSKKIIFEISGENLFSNPSSLGKSFLMLSHTGIQISLGIFTLGHFALQKITQLPIDYLKIDAKLIQEKKKHEESEIIMHMIVTLAKDMKISVVAEGVENELQKDMLRDLGCEIMQGKLFGDPLPVAE